MRVRVLVLGGVLAWLAVQPAAAQTQADADACNGKPPQYSDGQVIAACSIIIRSGQADSVNMSAFYTNRGFAYDRLGDLPNAIADYSQAIALNPSNEVAYSDRGGAYTKQQNYAQAMSDLNRAIQLNAGDADAYYNRGLVYGAQSDHARAIADYDQAIRLSPASVYYAERARERVMLEDLDGAFADASQAIALDPREPTAYYFRSLILAAASRFDEAMSDIDQFIRLNPQSPDGPRVRALILDEKSKAGR